MCVGEAEPVESDAIEVAILSQRVAVLTACEAELLAMIEFNRANAERLTAENVVLRGKLQIKREPAKAAKEAKAAQLPSS